MYNPNTLVDVSNLFKECSLRTNLINITTLE